MCCRWVFTSVCDGVFGVAVAVATSFFYSAIASKELSHMYDDVLQVRVVVITQPQQTAGQIARLDAATSKRLPNATRSANTCCFIRCAAASIAGYSAAGAT